MRWLLVSLVMVLTAGVAAAATYDLPARLGSPPFANCSRTTYVCTGSVSIGNADTINFTQDMTLDIQGGGFQLGNNSNITNVNHHVVAITTSGDIQLGNSFVGSVNFSAGGNFSAGNTAAITGNISAEGNVSLGNSATVTGNVEAGANLSVGSGTITGTCTYATTNYTCIPSATLDHVELVHDGSAIACNPENIIVRACANAACSSLYTSGVSGSLAAGGNAVAAFVIANGSSSTTISTYLPNSSGIDPQTVRLGTSSVSPSPSASSPTCNNGTTANNTTACDVSVSKAGFLFDVPTLTSGVASGTVSIQAVRSATGTVCAPLFQNVTRTIAFWGSYLNPSNGTLKVQVNGSDAETTASPAYTSIYALNFNASGTASLTSVRYDDVGKMRLGARYLGSAGNTPPDGGMIVTGSDDFVVKPYGFKLTGLTCAATDKTSTAAGAFCVAGGTFTGTVQAVKFDPTQSNNLGAVTPNFGQESPAQTVTFAPVALVIPTAAAGGTLSLFTSSSTGNFSGTPNQATTTMIWPNVGTITIKPTTDYLATGDLSSAGISDSTAFIGNVGRFYPHHFSLAGGSSVTAGCGIFTYMDQPSLGISFTVEARNKTDALTTNYHYAAIGGYAALGTVDMVAENANTGSNLASRISGLATPHWAGGKYIASTAAATFSKNAFPDGSYESLAIGIRITDDDAVLTGLNMNAATANDCTAVPNCDAARVGTTAIRSGRLRLFNAVGSEKSALAMAAQTQYWSGNSWVLNSDDTCTSLPANSFALSGEISAKTSVSGAMQIGVAPNTGGNGTLTLKAPTGGTTGSVDVAANLGASGDDVSCLSVHGGTAAGLSWLRSRNGDCASTYNRDPAARATFGIYTPETRRTVHIREQF